MKHLTLRTKLLLLGLLAMTIPIIVIGGVAIYEASLNISEMGKSDLEHTARGLASALDVAMDEQVAVTRAISCMNDVVSVAEKIAKEGTTAGRDEILAPQKAITRIKKVSGDRLDTIVLVGKDKSVFASSEDERGNGINLSGAESTEAALRGASSVGNVRISSLTGKVVVTVGYPIHDSQGKEVVGAVAMGMDLMVLSDILNKVKIGKTGYAYVVQKDGLYIYHPYKERILKENIREVKGMESVTPLLSSEKGGIVEYTSIEGIEKLASVTPVPATGWTVVATIPTEELYAPAHRTRTIIGIIALVSLVVASIVFCFFARSLTLPLNNLVGAARKIAAGDVNVEVTVENRRDEIGALAQAFTEMAGSLREKTRIAQKISGGDLTVEMPSISESDSLGNAFSTMVGVLRRQIQDIVEGVDVLASSGSEIMATISQLGSSVAETSTAVSETTTTAEEVRQTTDVNARKAQHVSELGRKSLEISQNGQKSIEATIAGMSRIKEQVEAISDMVVRLSEQSQAIGEIIATVNDLAEQSNLLAVNASIEAAKAGEQGKGFGVVAQEIRSLASGSKQATAQVRNILFDVQKAITSAVMVTEQGSKAVEEGVRLSMQAGEAIDVLAGSVAAATDAAVQIAASSQQQILGADQVVTAMENIREATLQMNAGTKQTEKTVHDLQNVSRRLQNIVKFYKV